MGRTIDMSACDGYSWCRENPGAAAVSLATQYCKMSCESCWDWAVTMSPTYLGKSTDADFIQGKAKFLKNVRGYTLTASETDWGQDYAALVKSDNYEGITPQWDAPVTIPQVNVPKHVLSSSLLSTTITALSTQMNALNFTAVGTLYKTF